MMTLVTMLILSILAAELVYQNQVYASIVFRQRDQLRARLLAKSALRLGLLQLTATEKAKAQIKNLGLGDESLANQIWQTPIILPPPALPGMNTVDTQALEAFNKALGIEGKLTVTISGESDRLDLNQLVKVTGVPANDENDPSKPKLIKSQSTVKVDPEQVKAARNKLLKVYADILEQIFQKRKDDDKEFAEKYQNLKAEALLFNLVAFMDPETKTDGDNQDKGNYYAQATPPYDLKNAPLVTETELSMVKGFDDTIAAIVAEAFTFQPTTSINVNKAPPTLLQGLIYELTNDNLDRLIKRRSDSAEGGPFKTADEFWAYLQTLGEFGEAQKRLKDNNIGILGADTSYRVSITSDSGMIHQNWLARVGKMPALSDADKAEAQQLGQQQATFTQPPPAQEKTEEGQKAPAKNSGDQMRILYLRAE